MNKMTVKTVEGFIHNLQKEGLFEHASELRTIVAMSRKRKDALQYLSGMTVPLLEHIIKYESMPLSRDKNKWHGEIKGYLNKFNIRNKSPKGIPWLTIEYIQMDLNDVLSSPEFIVNMEEELKTYSKEDRNRALNLIKRHKTIKSLGIKLFYDQDNSFNISIKGQGL